MIACRTARTGCPFKSLKSQRSSHRRDSSAVCELNELNRLEGTSFPTPLNDDSGRSHESDATAFHDGDGQFDQPERGILEDVRFYPILNFGHFGPLYFLDVFTP